MRRRPWRRRQEPRRQRAKPAPRPVAPRLSRAPRTAPAVRPERRRPSRVHRPAQARPRPRSATLRRKRRGQAHSPAGAVATSARRPALGSARSHRHPEPSSCLSPPLLDNSKSARRSRSVKAIVTSFRVLRLRLGNDVRQPSRRKDWFTAPATRRFDSSLIHAAGVSCPAQEDGAGKVMTLQSETAGFGPRPRWRRFHQGALALAVAAPLAGSALLVAAALAPASAQTRMVEIGENKVGGVRVTQGKSQTLQTTLGFVDLVVGDPEIADVMPLTDRTLYVLGKKLGTTNVSVYDAAKSLVGVIEVEVSYNTPRLASDVEERLPGERTRVSSANGRTVLSGTMNDSVSAARAVALAKQYGPEVLNDLKVRGSQQVMLEVRFVEVSRNAGKDVGVSWQAVGKNFGPTRGLAPEAAPRPSAPSRPRPVERRAGGRPVQALEDGARAPSRRAEPRRDVGREGELPRRRRVPDPGGRQLPADHRRVQEVRRRPDFPADGPRQRRDQPQDRARGEPASTRRTRSAPASSRSRRSRCAGRRR